MLRPYFYLFSTLALFVSILFAPLCGLAQLKCSDVFSATESSGEGFDQSPIDASGTSGLVPVAATTVAGLHHDTTVSGVSIFQTVIPENVPFPWPIRFFADADVLRDPLASDLYVYVTKHSWIRFWRGLTSSESATDKAPTPMAPAVSAPADGQVAVVPLLPDSLFKLPIWYLNLVSAARDVLINTGATAVSESQRLYKRDRAFRAAINGLITNLLDLANRLESRHLTPRLINSNTVETIGDLPFAKDVKALIGKLIDRGYTIKFIVSEDAFVYDFEKVKVDLTDSWFQRDGPLFRGWRGLHNNDDKTIELPIFNIAHISLLTERGLNGLSLDAITMRIIKNIEKTLRHEGLHAMSSGAFKVRSLVDFVVQGWAPAEASDVAVLVDYISHEKQIGLGRSDSERLNETTQWLTSAPARFVSRTYGDGRWPNAKVDDLIYTLEQLYNREFTSSEKAQVIDFLNAARALEVEARPLGPTLRSQRIDYYATRLMDTIEQSSTPDQVARGRILAVFAWEVFTYFDEALAHKVNAERAPKDYGFMDIVREEVDAILMPSWRDYIDLPEELFGRRLDQR